MEHPPYFPDLAPNDFWLFPNINSALKKNEDFRILKTSKKCDDGTERYSTTGDPKMFPIVAVSLVSVHSYSRGVL
jgi:hypothetical protein